MKKTFSILLAIVLAFGALLSIGCQPPPPASVTVTYTVAKFVPDADPVLEVGATIKFTNASGAEFSGTTDENGQFTIVLVVGEYTVTAENLSSGYSLIDSKVTVSAGETSKNLAVEQTSFDVFPNAEGILAYAVSDTEIYTTFTIPAGKTYSFSTIRTSGRMCTITTDCAVVNYLGDQFPPISGKVTFIFEGEVNNMFAQHSFSVTNPSSNAITISFVLSVIEEDPGLTPDIGGGNIDTIG